MSTVTKALELLNYFSSETPELGLSEFARAAARDKATVYRHLSALEKSGFIEKNPRTSHYRLGPAVLPLSRLREATVPRAVSVKQPLAILAQTTGETAHVSLLQGAKLVTLARQTSQAHSTGVVVNEKTLPLHASGSGLAVLAFSGDTLRQQSYAPLARFTEHTVTTPQDLEERLTNTRKTGFGIANQTFETGVHGIGAPVFDDSGTVAGAIAVAAPAYRINARLDHTIKSQLIIAARSITAHWGGRVPTKLDDVWDEHSKAASEIGANE